MTANHSFYLGTRDWNHCHWNKSFYPEEIPADWQLGFYNVRFTCVLLPFERWCQATTEEIVLWCDDTLERFRFLVELPDRPLSAAEETLLETFGERLALKSKPGDERDTLLLFDAKVDLRQLASELRAPGPLPRYLISMDADLGCLERVEILMTLMDKT
jgi:hypothetical protein